MLQFVLLVATLIVGGFALFGDIALFADLSAGEITSMVFLALVSIVFIGSVIGSGEKLSAMARHLAIAVSVTLAIVIGWEYRYELQGAVTRIVAGVVPGAPISTVDENGDLSVTLSRVNRHFQALASVNGDDQPFIVDTGASTVVLTYENAREAGFDVASLAFIVPVSTANGMTRAAPIVIDTLSVGDIERQNVRAMVAQEAQLFENLLGMSFLDRLEGYDVRGSKASGLQVAVLAFLHPSAEAGVTYTRSGRTMGQEEADHVQRR
ncbi:MAG: TIGR02281 family clan AA aspartic protease [Pseudomonadota bacterium]